MSGCGATCVQIDFTEGRLALKLDPSGGLLNTFVALNNRVLGQLHRRRKAAHRHSHLSRRRPRLYTQRGRGLHRFVAISISSECGRFYIQLASEPDRPRVLKAVRQHLKPGQVLFIGVTDPINPRIESPEEVRDRVLEAAELIPVESLGTTDDCGFSPFADDTSTSRDTAFAKVKNRVEGTLMASNILKV